jgi:hypothetical protein
MCMERESRRLCQISRKCIAMEKWGNLRSSFIGLVCTLLYYRVKHMCTSNQKSALVSNPSFAYCSIQHVTRQKEKVMDANHLVTLYCGIDNINLSRKTTI